ncbi:MAG: glycerol-3-phosphate dehydrogenase/oxidase [Candidatus Binatia bacterium]|nr:MAG: glycerol-3-phosphate dehydrogenase/oxidase [Candidatus Binatia bacterium]
MHAVPKERKEGNFSQRRRAASIAELERGVFDVLVVGGGITGAGVAREAALRGLRVALVERRDFAFGTSSRSSKLIHGGLRYLEQGDVGLVREAATERQTIRRLAPYLVRPVEMLVPVASRRGQAKLRVGLWAYDKIARVPEEERHRILDKEEALAVEPLLRPENVHGAGLYYEYLTDDARLVLAVLKRAAELGAVALNYASVVGLLSDSRGVQGAEVRDELGDGTFRVRARVVVNAAGPWVDAVRLLGDGGRPRLHLTKGVHLVVPREKVPVGRIVVMSARDRRSVFAVPRERVVYVGTTDTDYEGSFDDPPVSLEDAEYLLDAVVRTLRCGSLEPSDVCAAWAGLRPLLHEEGKKPSEISRRDEIWVEKNGLVSVAGGKLTTFRKMAQRVLEKVEERLRAQGVSVPPDRGASDVDPLSGGETGQDLSAYAHGLRARWPAVAPEAIERLVAIYGSLAERILGRMTAEPELAEPLTPGSPVTRAEVEYAVTEEMAATLRDFLERRTRMLLFDLRNGLPEAPEAARLLGELLGWSEHRVREEAAAYAESVRALRTFVSGRVAGRRTAHA